jgi:hypothetical protein
MCQTKYVLHAILLASSACWLRGQTTQSTFATAKSYSGTFSIEGKSQGSGLEFGQFNSTWMSHVTVSGSLKLDTREPDPAGVVVYRGTVTGTATIDAQRVTILGLCTQTITIKQTVDLATGSKVDGGFPRKVELIITGGFYYLLIDPLVDVTVTTTNSPPCSSTTQVVQAYPVIFTPFYQGKGFPLPPQGQVLSGSATVTALDPISLPTIDYVENSTWQLTAVPHPLEVIIEPQGYDTWRPQAGIDEKAPGNNIEIRATLRYKDGTPLDVSAQDFVFKLANVSQEPGIALNYPSNHGPALPDLHFDPATNPSLTIYGDGGEAADTGPGDYRQASAVVTSGDWGAWGEVQVTAMMPDGTSITGHLVGDDAQISVRLPKRSADSHIADVWKQAHGVSNLPDDDDSENDPVGDGTPGDGLSLYEEYRGFYEKGVHIEGDPRRKDYFIHDAMKGAISKSGIALFARLSGLRVHHMLMPNEVAADHTINFNYGGGAHLSDQHAVVIVPVTGSGRAEAEITGLPGPPGRAGTIRIPTEYGITYKWEGQRTTSYMATTVAHELFHASSVFHHGEIDQGPVTWTPDPNSGAITENGVPVTVLFESSNQPLQMKAPDTVYIGSDQGHHSGVELCLMRYDLANAYVSHRDPTVRYYIYHEQWGNAICDTAVGDGVNAPDHQPQPRYGDAAGGRGACAKQICINDVACKR